MAQKRGLVKHLSRDGWAMVVTERDDACSNCESAQFCHSLEDCSRMETRVLNRANAGAGDRVVISLCAKEEFICRRSMQNSGTNSSETNMNERQ